MDVGTNMTCGLVVGVGEECSWSYASECDIGLDCVNYVCKYGTRKAANDDVFTTPIPTASL